MRSGGVSRYAADRTDAARSTCYDASFASETAKPANKPKQISAKEIAMGLSS
jgi:hypothetical protein